MKWFKHLTTAMNDIFVMDLEREFSHLGYAFWFKTLELIGSQGEDGKLRISWPSYCRIIRTRKKNILALLEKSQTNSKLSFKTFDGEVEIDCPKFREYADNYTKYDGLSSKTKQRKLSVSSKQEVEGEVEEDKKKKEKEIKKAPPPPDDFELIWKRYPIRKGKPDALRHFRATVKTPEDAVAIGTALTNYLASGNVKSGYIQNGSTWFHQWQDWVTPSEAMMKGNTNGEKKKEFDVHDWEPLPKEQQ